jgi:hypothetical protein
VLAGSQEEEAQVGHRVEEAEVRETTEQGKKM